MNKNTNDNPKYIYVVISRTQTKFGSFLRKMGRLEYNHTSLGLDANLNEIYAFARPQYSGIFLGRLVRESLVRYTLKNENSVPIKVFKLPVSHTELSNLREELQTIISDREYVYNLFSVLTYPITHGFSTYKAFNCTEFVAHILKELNFPLEKPAHAYRPDDFSKILEQYIIFAGDIRDCMKCTSTDELYFEPNSLRMFYRNLVAFFRIGVRTCFYRKKSNI